MSNIRKKSRAQSRLEPRSRSASRKSLRKSAANSATSPKRVGAPKTSRIQSRMVGGQMVRVQIPTKSRSLKKWRDSPSRRIENSPRTSRVQTIIKARSSPKPGNRSAQSSRSLLEPNPQIKKSRLPLSSSAKQLPNTGMSWRIATQKQERKEINDKLPQRRNSRSRKYYNSSSSPLTVSYKNTPQTRSLGITRGRKEVRETYLTQPKQSYERFNSRSPSHTSYKPPREGRKPVSNNASSEDHFRTYQSIRVPSRGTGSTDSREQPEGEDKEARAKRKPLCNVSVLEERIYKVHRGVGELRQVNTDKSNRLDFLEWEIKKLFKWLDTKTSQNLSLESKNNAIRPRAMTTSLERDVRREMRENQEEWERVFENKNLQPDYKHHTWNRTNGENQLEVLQAEDDLFC